MSPTSQVTGHTRIEKTLFSLFSLWNQPNKANYHTYLKSQFWRLNSDSSTQRDRGRSDLFIYLRIFLILGLTWIFGVLVMFTPDGSLIEKDNKSPIFNSFYFQVLIFPGDHPLFRCDWQSPGLHPLLDFYFQQASLWPLPQAGPEAAGEVSGSPGGEGEAEAEGCHGQTAVPVSQCGRAGPAEQQVEQHDGLAGQV